MKINDIEIDEYTYPRPQMDKQNINTLIEKLKAGIELDSIEVQKVKMPDEKERNILTNGAHRLEAYKEFNKLGDYTSITDISVKFWKEETLDYEKNKDDILIHAYNINDDQGLNMRSMDTKETARKLKRKHPDWSEELIGKKLDRSQPTIHEYIRDIIQDMRKSDQQLILRLSRLGWKQQDIAEHIKITQPRVNQIINNIETNKIYNFYKQGKSPEKIGEMFDIDEQTVWSIILQDKEDREKFELLDLEPKIYDNWNFSECNNLMGIKYPGQIPGQIVMNTLYYYTKPGDLVIDFMSGGGTTGDTCLLMNRKCYCFDRKTNDNGKPYREFIKIHDLYKNGSVVLPDTKKPKLVFVDPPYWSMKNDEYGEGSISDLSLKDFYDFIEKFAKECYDLLDNDGVFAFLIQNQTEKNIPEGKESISHTYNCTKIIESVGFNITRIINCPQNTETFLPQQVISAKEENRMLGVVRDLLIFKKNNNMFEV